MINDKVVNTRVSKKLYEKIFNKAKKNRVSISNLIRNLVEDTLEIHEDIHDAIDKKIRKYLSDTEKQNILGYQEITLAKDTLCDNCGKELKTSDTAYVAYLAESDSKIILCSTCKAKISKSEKKEPHATTADN
ncbi:MAG: hypothetical protein US54_C0065G0006 [Candidatus Roizmanbacteria bacterium GW2011_GWA2_37_7]|uniref:Uncharacterized protein n=1 Tax=Candidatus Roizmanbacteria bacterium GW2011_GWA2_37_7 TaxID=1618481 RepID=A0A0G0K798_9BACT|nr:MAG: hypothetical protein US54_C0065G0006 [Candidatus Roizmanbacteria bacterium GW2011_GWA2_37_7]